MIFNWDEISHSYYYVVIETENTYKRIAKLLNIYIIIILILRSGIPN